MEKEKNDIIKVLTMKPFWSDNDKLCTVRAVISFVFAMASFILMFADLKSGTIQMAISSIVLVVGFISSGIIAGVFKKPTIAGFLIAGLAIFVLTGYIFCSIPCAIYLCVCDCDVSFYAKGIL